MPSPHAIIFIPENIDLGRWIAICSAYCVAQGYMLHLVVRRWADVDRLVVDGEPIVIVTPSRDMLPPDRLPRLEVLAESQTHPAVPPEKRRVTRRRNWAAG